jgi:hypothetical protein
MIEHPIELADIFRLGFSDYAVQQGPLPGQHYKVANALMSCHTSALGGHIYRCEQCGHEKISYNSCRNRHCPSCQATARAQWVDNRMKELLPVPYFHVVFTLPSKLNLFALRNKEAFYNILFQAASETLQTLAGNPKRLGAEIGFIAILHTWGHHDHVSFKWKDYAHENKPKVMTLTHVEFIRRFLLHVVPHGFVRIRYFGFLSQAVKKEKLTQCMKLLGVKPLEPLSEDIDKRAWNLLLKELRGEDPLKCPLCNKGRLVPYREIPRPKRKEWLSAAA